MTTTCSNHESSCHDGIVDGLDQLKVSNDEECRKVSDDGIVYVTYESEKQMDQIMKLIQKDLSEPILYLHISILHP